MKQLLKHSVLLGCGCIGMTLLATGALAEVPTGQTGHESAVWQERKYSFVFLGFTTTYSCDGLAEKLKVLLLAAGARSDAKASPGACAEGFGRPDKFARADLTFNVLVPAGGPVAAGGTTIDGVWRPVEFASRKPRELGTGDCELVEQFKSNVLPLFTTRNVEEHTTCIPHQDSGSSIDLTFEALSAAAQKPKQPPVQP